MELCIEKRLLKTFSVREKASNYLKKKLDKFVSYTFGNFLARG